MDGALGQGMSQKIWIVAAGTGGHIFPGLNVAQAIKDKNPQQEFLFFGTRDRLESKIIPARGYKIKFLKAGMWKGLGPVARVLGLLDMAVGFFQTCVELLRERPRCLVGVGGYVSVPVALACVMFRVPFFILEPNIRAGLANKILSTFAKAAFSTKGSDSKKVLKCEVYELGNPVRFDLKKLEIRLKAKKILVLGGSQGAMALCKLSLEWAKEIDLKKHDLEMCLQSGEKNKELSEALKNKLALGEEVKILPFIDDVPQFLSQADFVVARAGAMTVAELAAVGMPTIFVPFPFAADDHQRVNARILQQDGAALMVDERDTQYQEQFKVFMADLLIAVGNYEKRQKLSSQFIKWGNMRAAQDIAERLLLLSTN